MRRVLFLILMAFVSSAAMCQQYSVRPGFVRNDSSIHVDSSPFAEHLRLSGKYLKTSGRLDIAAWGFLALSGLGYSGVFGDANNVNIVLGSVFAACAVGSKAFSVVLKCDSGRELELSADCVRLRF